MAAFGMVMKTVNISVYLKLILIFGKRKSNGIENVIRKNNASLLLWAGIVLQSGSAN